MRRNKAGKYVMLLGVLCIVAALSLAVYNAWDDHRATVESAEIVDEVRAAIVQRTEHEPDTEENNAANEKTITVDGDTFLGCLLVPSMGLEIPIRLQFSMEGMESAAVCYAGSMEEDNLVIAGHNYSRIFRPIKQLPEGALVQILDAGGKVTDYEVVSLEILNPDQVDALTADSDDWDLSLFTCTTGGGSRYVVRCARVDQ